MLDILAMFGASFGTVFLLGLNSQFARDQRIALCFAVSWFISLSQFTYTSVIASSTGDPLWLFFASGWGGSLGIVTSILVYKWVHPKLKEKKSC